MPSSQDPFSRLRDEIHGALSAQLRNWDTELKRLQASFTTSLASLDEISRKLQGGGGMDTSSVDEILEEVLASAASDGVRRKDEELSFFAHFSYEIRQKETQEEILNLLLDTAHRYAPRLVLFVTRGNRFMSWSSRGFEDAAAGGLGTCSLSFPESPFLQGALNAEGLKTTENIREESSLLRLLPTGIKGPWHAFPLTAIGRSVAVLLAMAVEERSCDLEPLCVLMNVTGLCIENLALRILQETRAMEAPAPPPVPPEPDSPVDTHTGCMEVEADEPVSAPVSTDTVAAPVADKAPVEEAEAEEPVELAPEPPAEVPAVEPETGGETESAVAESEVASQPEVAEPHTADYEAPQESQSHQSESAYEATSAREIVPVIPPGEPEPAAAEEPSEPQKASVLREVQPLSEEEKLHADAKRFARLLATEIKLYNEQRVEEGRANRDLYVRLKRDIDRSREMYEKRVSPTVSRKIDYFHDEIVRVLGDNDPSSLGSDYPGPRIES